MKGRDQATRGIVAAWVLLLCEASVVLLAQRRSLTSVWEVQWGLLALCPMALVVAGVLGALAGLWFWLICKEQNLARILVGLAIGVPVAIAGWGIGGGRHLAIDGIRGTFAAGLGALAALGAFALAPWLRRVIRHHPLAVGFAAALLAVNLEFANQRLLVRLYPTFHLSLAAGCLLLAPFVLLLIPPIEQRQERPRSVIARRLGWIPWLTIVGAGALAPIGARSLSNFDNLRLLLVDSAPMLGQAVRLAAWLAPPPPIRSSCLTANASVDCAAPTNQKGRAFSLAGRDLLLITIDALRADHLGAYGYGRPTTPHMDALAKSGVRFERAYAATAHTSYSVTSLMTGKYMRPLLLQGAGHDSDTFATLLQHYAIRTAAFYPPAVFFIDPARFEAFQKSYLGFEYRKVEFLEGPARADQVRAYVETRRPEQRLFLWVHLFAPHEPYEKHDGFDFGDRDVDRYDSEVAYADDAVGRIVADLRRARPKSLVIVSADHGEEFGDHGGRYHGTTVYEEQLRVPLIVNAPDLFEPRVVREPVQTIDLLPTVLAALDVPRPPRIRGRDLGGLLTGKTPEGPGLALAETEEQLLLAEGSFRLICMRQLGACKLFNLDTDPGERHDVSADFAGRLAELRRRERDLAASHGQFEAEGLRAEGKGWPQAILRGVAGDGDAADEIAALLDDADATIRRKAAELLFELRRPSTRDPLLLALARDEDATVKAWAALALTRLGHGAPLVVDLLVSPDKKWKRLAALALAEAGDRRGGHLLVEWWRDESNRTYQRSRELLGAIGRIRWRDAVVPLCKSLGDVRLRPAIANALADIGDDAARGPLVHAFSEERYQSARVALAQALARLKAKEELARPLIRFMGVPDAMPGALGIALRAGILEHVGGPNGRDLHRLQQKSNIGVTIKVYIPKYGNNKGIRVLLRVSNPGPSPGEVRIGTPRSSYRKSSTSSNQVSKNMNEFSSDHYIGVSVPAETKDLEVVVPVPAKMGLRPGLATEIRLLSTTSVRVEALAVVPLANEIPAPPPEPWNPGDDGSDADP